MPNKPFSLSLHFNLFSQHIRPSIAVIHFANSNFKRCCNFSHERTELMRSSKKCYNALRQIYIVSPADYRAINFQNEHFISTPSINDLRWWYVEEWQTKLHIRWHHLHNQYVLLRADYMMSLCASLVPYFYSLMNNFASPYEICSFRIQVTTQ